jgi:hypothetical protein
MQRVKRFARYWELLANSGRFSSSLGLLLGTGSAFHRFLSFSDWLWQTTGKTHEFAQEKLVDFLYAYLTDVLAMKPEVVRGVLVADYQASGARGKPQCFAVMPGLQRIEQTTKTKINTSGRAERQLRHLKQPDQPSNPPNGYSQAGTPISAR